MIKAWILTVFSLTLFTVGSASAQRDFDDTERPRFQSLQYTQTMEQNQSQRDLYAFNHRASDIQDHRRSREERGRKRLKQHEWRTGYTMPQHYRGNSYKVSYDKYDLPKPNRQQQWYKVNNDFILIDAVNNNILQIIKP